MLNIMIWLGMVIAGLIAFGLFANKNPKILDELSKIEGGVVKGLVRLAPLLLLLIPFVLDYTEAINVADFAERALEWKRETALIVLLVIAWSGSFSAIIAFYYISSKAMEDGIFDAKEKVIGGIALLPALLAQGIILWYGYTVHVEIHAVKIDVIESKLKNTEYNTDPTVVKDLFEKKGVEEMGYKMGKERFGGQVLMVILNIFFTLLSVYLAHAVNTAMNKPAASKSGGAPPRGSPPSAAPNPPTPGANPPVPNNPPVPAPGNNPPAPNPPAPLSPVLGKEQKLINYINQLSLVSSVPINDLKGWLFEYIGLNLDYLASNPNDPQMYTLFGQKTAPSITRDMEPSLKLIESKKLIDKIIDIFEMNSASNITRVTSLSKSIEEAETIVKNKQLALQSFITGQLTPDKITEKGKIESEKDSAQQKVTALIADRKTAMGPIILPLKGIGCPVS